jgi:hypothetical protein
VVLDQLNDTAVTTAGYVPLVSTVGNEGNVGVGVNDCASRDGLNFCTDGTHPVPRALMQIAQVQAVSGKLVTLDVPVYATHLATLSPQVFYWDGGNLAYAGVENLGRVWQRNLAAHRPGCQRHGQQAAGPALLRDQQPRQWRRVRSVEVLLSVAEREPGSSCRYRIWRTNPSGASLSEADNAGRSATNQT